MVRGTFLARVNRFTVEVWVNGRRDRAHLPNPGRLSDVLQPGRVVLLRPARPGRRTSWTAVAADLGEFLVSLDSTLPNRSFPRFLALGVIPELRGSHIAAKEPRLGAGRTDFLLWRGDQKIWVEVKSVTLVEDGVALFPDAPTTRGTRHLWELAARAQAGEEAFVVFVVQRPDAQRFKPNDPVDPHFAEALACAVSLGVQPRAIVCSFDGEDLHPLRVLGPESLVLAIPCGHPPTPLP